MIETGFTVECRRLALESLNETPVLSIDRFIGSKLSLRLCEAWATGAGQTVLEEEYKPTTLEDCWVNVSVNLQLLAVSSGLSYAETCHWYRALRASRIIFPSGVLHPILASSIRGSYNDLLTRHRSAG